MSFKASVLSIATAVAALSQLTAWAQAGAVSPSRADVKTETRTALKAGQLTPAGEGFEKPVSQAPSGRTRTERKAETIQARHAGELRKAGEEPDWKAARAAARVPSTTTRAERKTTTLAAARAGQLTPAGEGSPRKQ